MKEVTLKLAEVTDAEFILSLRLDEDLNRHLSKTKPDLEAQKQWLAEYKKREVEKQEFYFLILLNEKPIGTVRIYDINYNDKTYTWGSWIISRDVKDPKVAIYSTFLIYKFCFEELGLLKAIFDVRNDNNSVIKFHTNYGSKVLEKDLENTYFEFEKENFYNIFKIKFAKFI